MMRKLNCRWMFTCTVIIIFICGADNVQARTQLTRQAAATELKEWDMGRCTNYALTENGGKAGLLFPDDPKYGSQKSLLTIIDNVPSSSVFVTQKGVKPSKKHQIVLELSEPKKISAFFWFGNIKGQRGYGRAPRSYTVKVSPDGKKWTTVARQNKIVNKQLHIFDPIIARYVAMADIISPPGLEMRVREVGVYDLTTGKSDYSVENPPWWNRDYKFRIQIKDGKRLSDGGRIIRQVNFTNLLQVPVGLAKKVPVAPIDLSDIRIVHCVKLGNNFEQKEYLPNFIPDARFNLNNYAVGQVIWSVPSRMADGSWWLFANTKITDKNNAKTKPVNYSLNLPVWNYSRGFPISGTITLKNNAVTKLTGTLKINLNDGSKSVFTKGYPVKQLSGKSQEISFNVPTSSIACKDYELEFIMLSNKGAPLFSTAASITIAPTKKHHLEFGCYGWPESNEQGCITWANIMAEHNISACVAGGHNASLDAATALGINFYPRGPRQGMYPPGPQKVISENGVTKTHRWGNTYCPNDPHGLKKMYDMVKTKASKLHRLYSSFRGFSCFDDYAFEPIKEHGVKRWSCYCPYCRKRYQDKYGSSVPYLEKNTSGKDDAPGQKRIIHWDNHIVPDSDPALRFIVERCKSVGDYIGNYEKARQEVDPSLEIGMMRQFSMYVAWGEWPPYGFKDAKVLSMYDYVSSGCLPLDYITNYELVQMGNRGKKSWILMEAVDIFQQMKGKQDISVPPWLIRSEFWNGLAAGYKNMGFYGLARLLEKDTVFSREVTRLGALSRKIGPLFGTIQPARAEVAILASFPDFVQPDNINAWRPAFSRVNGMHNRLLTNGVPCEIVADDEAVAGYLKNYKVVIIPAVNYLRQSAYDSLKKYRGGIFVDERCPIKIPGARKLSLEKIVTEAAIYSDNIPANTGDKNVVYREFDFPGGALFVLVNSQAQVSGQLRKYRWGKMKMIDARPVNCRFKLKENWFCYDLVQGKLLETTDDQVIPVDLEAGGGKILVCYKQPIERVLLKPTVTNVRRGTSGIITATIQSGEKRSTAAHLLELTVIRPDGQLSNEYSRTLLAENGTAKINIPFAVNDPLGTWRIEVTEVASNIPAAGLLFPDDPALNKAKEGAKQIQCINSLKNISVAIIGYSVDFNSWVPFKTLSGGSDSKLHTGGYLAANKGAWECPSTDFTSHPYSFRKPSNTQLGYEMCMGYELNTTTWSYSPRRLTNFKEPTKTGIVADTTGSATRMYYYGMNYIDSASCDVAYRHNGGFNVLFVAGNAMFFKTLSQYKNYKTTIHWWEP